MHLANMQTWVKSQVFIAMCRECDPTCEYIGIDSKCCVVISIDL